MHNYIPAKYILPECNCAFLISALLRILTFFPVLTRVLLFLYGVAKFSKTLSQFKILSMRICNQSRII